MPIDSYVTKTPQVSGVPDICPGSVRGAGHCGALILKVFNPKCLTKLYILENQYKYKSSPRFAPLVAIWVSALTPRHLGLSTFVFMVPQCLTPPKVGRTLWIPFKHMKTRDFKSFVSVGGHR